MTFMVIRLQFGKFRVRRIPVIPEVAFCEEKHRLTENFVAASRELLNLQSQQSQAVIDGDPDFARFDLLLHMAGERKDLAKYALLFHMESHHC
jgi:hypothetical protein